MKDYIALYLHYLVPWFSYFIIPYLLLLNLISISKLVLISFREWGIELKDLKDNGRVNKGID